MADEPKATDVAKDAAVTSFTWLNLAINALSLMEKLLPAFLVAWNNTLQQKNRELSLKLDKAKLDATVTAYKTQEAKQNDSKDPKDVIDNFLSEPSSGGSGKPPAA